jgi:RpiB/LacA/LacB family sugar-phosphate isomerase
MPTGQMKKIYIASDHAGFELKGSLATFLRDIRYEVQDLGPKTYEPYDDYPKFAAAVCGAMLDDAKRGVSNRGVLICGSGLGMTRAANSFRGIFADNCWNVDVASSSRRHGNTNVLCIGQSAVTKEDAEKIVGIWLTTPFEGGRHARRTAMIDELKKTGRS